MVTTAPAVIPSASSRSTRAPGASPTLCTSACVPTASADSGTGLEVNVKSVQDIVQTRSREDGDRRNHGDDAETDLEPALAHHDEKVGDARDEQRHHGQRDHRLHPGQLTAVRQLEEAGGA